MAQSEMRTDRKCAENIGRSKSRRRRMQDWIITSSSCYVNFHSKLIETISMGMSECVWVSALCVAFASVWAILAAAACWSFIHFDSERTKSYAHRKFSSTVDRQQRRCNQKYEKTFKKLIKNISFFSAEIASIAMEDVCTVCSVCRLSLDVFLF